MRIPTNVILIWPKDNAGADGIPVDWERETTLDGKYLKGASTGSPGGTNSGNPTHTHTSPAHSHVMDSHAHSLKMDINNSDRNDEGGSSGVPNGGTTQSHNHNSTNTASSGGTLSDATTYASTANDPPYHEVIFIKAKEGAVLQNGIVAFWDRNTEPTGWNFCDGSTSSPDLRNKYLKGASTGANSGGTGGTLNHSHDVGHGHTSVLHSHTGRTSSPVDHGCDGDVGGGSINLHCNVCLHTHTFTYANSSTAVNAYVGTAGTAETVEPVYKKLNPMQLLAGGIKERGIIGMWLGALVDIPKGWLLCDGRKWTSGLTLTPDLKDYFLKCANTLAEGIGSTTGGSNTHIHAASNSHNHTATGTHTHTGSTAGSDSQSYQTGTGEHGNNSAGHIHWSNNQTSTATPTWQNSTITANSSDNQPEYRTVAFIQFENRLLMSGML